MSGILWHRLPTIVDNFIWRGPTLSAMVGARIPRKSVRVDTHRVESGLVEISLVNNGELDISSRLAVQTRWRGARLVAGDGLRGFELADREAFSARFMTGPRPHRLPAGEQEIIGWLRLSADREVQVELLESGERSYTSAQQRLFSWYSSSGAVDRYRGIASGGRMQWPFYFIAF